jgi:hypothetical protein
MNGLAEKLNMLGGEIAKQKMFMEIRGLFHLRMFLRSYFVGRLIYGDGRCSRRKENMTNNIIPRSQDDDDDKRFFRRILLYLNDITEITQTINASLRKDAAQIPQPVFGVTLQESLNVARVNEVPAIVFCCIQYIEATGADREEGIYRVKGDLAVIKSLKDRFNMGEFNVFVPHCSIINQGVEGDVDLLSSGGSWDTHSVADLLKTFLRELPESILTHELHSQFLAVAGMFVAAANFKTATQLSTAQIILTERPNSRSFPV